jgi:hypothetical protein
MGRYIWAVANTDGTLEHVHECKEGSFEPGPGYAYAHPFGDLVLDPGQSIIELDDTDFDDVAIEAGEKGLSPAAEIHKNRKADLAAPGDKKPIILKVVA